MGLTIKTSSGRSVSEITLRLRTAARLTVGDALYAGQRQRARMLERTARGVDVNNKQFAPYSTKGPFYYDPNSRISSRFKRMFGERISDKKQRASVNRLVRKVGSKGVQKSSTGRTLKFPSYAAFKRWLGRTFVDLRGPRSPHMLQGIVVKAGSSTIGESGMTISPDANPERVNEMRIGIYGAAAARAVGHNEGNPKKNLPKRWFIGASRSDLNNIAKDILARMSLRLRSRR